jgi:hypothetical protein
VTVQNAANAQAVNVVTTAETVAVALPQVAEAAGGGGGILIHGYVNFTPGTTAVSAQIKVRQGGTTGGAQVGPTDTVAGLVAGNPVSIPFAQIFGGLVMPYGNQFCVTVTQPAATANGTVNDATIFADAVSVGG